ncbi:hypothetical protein MSS4_05433 [Mycobacterium marinum]|nr:hypothetical protein MMEU_3457 [Mycobacterium marinum str. Europe]RFZ40736.1 hypothetical protein MSS4_05433 [Mycobacterium marinum]
MNNAAIPTDTSSAPAANKPIVGAAAALLAALTADPMPATSAAAALNCCGATFTNDTAHHPSVGKALSPTTSLTINVQASVVLANQSRHQMLRRATPDHALAAVSPPR